MNKSKVVKIVVSAIAALAVLFVAVITCMSLKYENQRTSKIIPYEKESSFLSDGDVLEQIVKVDEGEKQLCGFAVFLTQESPNPVSTLKVAFKENGNVVYSHEESAMSILYTAYKYFYFDEPLEVKDGSSYTIEVGVEGSEDRNGIGVYMGTDDGYGKCTVNGVPETGVACHVLIYDRVPLIKLILIPSVILAILILATLAIMVLNKTVLKNSKDRLFAGFAVFYALLLLLYSFIVPQCSVNDEADHFIRSYAIAHGYLISDVVGDNGQGGAVLPTAILKYQMEQDRNWHHIGQRDNDRQLKALVIDENDKSEVIINDTSLYVPFLYIPQVIGIKISELFTNRPFVIMACARIANMAAVFAMVLLAIRITPAGRELFMAISCFPFMLQDAVSCSPDSFITALVFIFCALVLYMRYKLDGPMGFKHLAVLFIATLFLCGIKLVYAPLVLILFFIPKKRFGDNGKYFVSIVVFALSSIIMCLMWLTVTTRYNLLLGNWSNHYRQKEYLLTDPLPFIKAVCDMIVNFGKYLFDMIGLNMGNENIYTSHLIPLTMIVIMTYVIISINRKSPDRGKWSWMIWLIPPVISGFLVLLSEYFYWTEVGATVMTGVAGRYFLPCATVVAVGLARPSKPVSLGYKKTIAFAIAMCNFFSLVMYWIYTVY